MAFLTSPPNKFSIEQRAETLGLDQGRGKKINNLLSVLILIFTVSSSATAPTCKYRAYKAANPIAASTIKQANTACMDVLQLYSNYLGVGKTASNGCSDWAWADRLHKNYGKKITASGVYFEEIPDLDNPLARPQSSKKNFRLKVMPAPEGYKAEILGTAPTGGQCILTLEIARPPGVAAPPVVQAAKKTQGKNHKARKPTSTQNKRARGKK